MAQKGVEGVRAEIADAQRDLARQGRRRSDPLPALERGDPPTKAGKWTPSRLGLPNEDPCPVEPLGFEGELFHLIDSSGQFRSMEAADFSQAGIQGLFAATPHYPKWAWPRYGRAKPDEAPPIKSFEADGVKEALFFACTRKGLFSPVDRLRGRGAWRMKTGGLIFHAGEELWLYEGGRVKVLECGRHEGYLYPRFPAIPPPWPRPIKVKDNPARELLSDFRTFSWERPEVDPVLLLGWLGVALIGGALKWRPAVFLIGDRETGKSTLQSLIKAILGDVLVSTAETTKAGIYQLMKHDSRAVAVDELEAASDNRKQMSVVELARVASSGGLGLRGGANGTGSEFQVRCAFLFSAINPPPMMPQDHSRFAKLRLQPRDTARSGDRPPEIDPGADSNGRMLLGRLMAEWHRWETTLEAYRDALRAGGHSGRGQDTYGTLLAIADLLLGPELAEELNIPMVDDLSFWSEVLAADAIAEVADALPNWQTCALHILTSRVPAWRDGKRATVGQVLSELDRASFGDHDGMDSGLARQMLGQAGIGLIDKMDRRYDFAGWGLAIPNQSPILAELFEGTNWIGAPGAPGWAEALRGGAPTGAIVTDKTRNRIAVNGVQCRCTLLDLEKFKELMSV